MIEFLVYSIATFSIFCYLICKIPQHWYLLCKKPHLIGLLVLGGPIFWSILIVIGVINLFNKLIEKFDEKFK